MQFQVEPIKLALQVVVTKDANGSIGWGALSIGGSYELATTQTLKLQLKPLWRRRDGTLNQDFVIADVGTATQRFGAAPPVGAAPPGTVAGGVNQDE